MNLFIDTISREGIIIIFDNKRKIKIKIILNIKWNESSKLIPSIDLLLLKNNLQYKQIANICVVNWPWSFTWIRTTVLTVNTINFVTNNNITPISYFELFYYYPIVKSSSKRDCFLKKDIKSEIEIIKNEDLINYFKENNISKVYWELNADIIIGEKIFEKINYENIINKIKFQDFKEITPLYIKKPNIS